MKIIMENILYALLVFEIIVFMYLIYFRRNRPKCKCGAECSCMRMIDISEGFYSNATPNIKSVHAINLDKDTERWEVLIKSANAANVTIERWPATYGKDIPYEKFRELGVGHAMVRPDRHDTTHKNLVNLGIVGCFISTRRLLTHLSEQYFSDSDGHLILDDDVHIPTDFLSQWEKKRELIPSDWDIVYMGVWNITGDNVAPGIKKLHSSLGRSGEPNVGTFAYVVRHGAIKPKILPWLRYMIDAIDEQLVLKFDEINAYGIEDHMIHINREMNNTSSIDEING